MIKENGAADFSEVDLLSLDRDSVDYSYRYFSEVCSNYVLFFILLIRVLHLILKYYFSH